MIPNLIESREGQSGLDMPLALLQDFAVKGDHAGPVVPGDETP